MSGNFNHQQTPPHALGRRKMNSQTKKSKNDNSNSRQHDMKFSLPRVDVVVQGQQIKNALHRSYGSPHQSSHATTESTTPNGRYKQNQNRKIVNRTQKSRQLSYQKHKDETIATDTNSLTSNSSLHQISTDSSARESPYTTDVHTLTISEVEKLFRTDIETGLDAAYADYLLKEIGPNALTPPEKDSEFVKWLKHVFLGVFNILLWMASLAQLLFYFLFPQNRDKLDVCNLYALLHLFRC